VQAAVTAAAGLNVNLRSVLEHAGTLAPVDPRSADDWELRDG
jgi:hypothetical protein